MNEPRRCETNCQFSNDVANELFIFWQHSNFWTWLWPLLTSHWLIYNLHTHLTLGASPPCLVIKNLPVLWKKKTLIMIEMHRTYKYFTGKNWQNLPLERIIDKNPSMSYLSLSGGKGTLIRLRKESVFLVFRYFFVHFCLRIWLTSQYGHLSVKTQSLTEFSF